MKALAQRILKAVAAMGLVALVTGSAWASPLTFGVMSDTQWSGTDPTGNNVNSVAVNQVKACNQAFINAGVSFVVQVGDLGDNGSVASLTTRLGANTALNAAGIPFYGLRGNHEDNSSCQTYFNANYIPASTATATVAVMPGTSNYSVTCNNTKIVLLDILTADSTTAMSSATTWMDDQLKAADHAQAFVFDHKNLVGQDHKDNAFGSSNDANPTQQNNFFSTLQNDGVRYVISGHDHQHYRSMVTAPNGVNKLQEVICASDSYKYYTYTTPFTSRDQTISQQQSKTGYYLFTVDGPRVTGKYYETTPLSNGDVPANPTWTLAETFGYSTNGKEFLVASGASLSTVQDTYGATSMKLAGINTSTFKSVDGRSTSKDINTGWTDRMPGLASDALTLWGTQDENYGASNTTSPFTLTMSYDSGISGAYIASGTENADGSYTWTPLTSTDNGDGTISTNLTGDGTFAVVPEPATMTLLSLGSLWLVRRRNNKQSA